MIYELSRVDNQNKFYDPKKPPIKNSLLQTHVKENRDDYGCGLTSAFKSVDFDDKEKGSLHRNYDIILKDFKGCRMGHLL